MAGVDLALATVGAVDVTLRYGKLLIETCRAFKHAEEEIRERALHIESCWKRTSLQLDFLCRVWGELDQEHQSIQNEILTVLNEKLRSADQKLKSYLKEQQPPTNVITDRTQSHTGKVKRFKYASLKESLDRTIRDLESWQKMFDPSWFLIMRVASQHVDMEAICSIHTFGFVHKSIRPENIMLFQDEDSKLGSAFLLGFEKIRLEEGGTKLRGDNAWEKNLYRHPERQGVDFQASYVMQHNIYSLGVCLLEIGLWQSFVHYSGTDSEHAEPGNYEFSGEAESVKNELIALANEKLPSYMGSKYAMIVKTCLTCLDEGIEDFGDEDELQDEDGVLVAVRYIEKVRRRAHSKASHSLPGGDPVCRVLSMEYMTSPTTESSVKKEGKRAAETLSYREAKQEIYNHCENVYVCNLSADSAAEAVAEALRQPEYDRVHPKLR
ncbi:MAG: hypothetical protein Q9157_002257 [Trypethelium eluteriae]